MDENNGVSNEKLTETNDWIRQSNQEYINKVLNTKADKNFPISNNPHRRSNASISG